MTVLIVTASDHDVWGAPTASDNSLAFPGLQFTFLPRYFWELLFLSRFFKKATGNKCTGVRQGESTQKGEMGGR